MLTLSICPLYFPGLQAISHSARLRRLPWGYSQAQHVFFSLPFPVVTVLPCPSHPSAELDKSVSLQSDLALPPFPPAHYLPAFTMTQQKCISPEKLCLTHTCPWILLRTHFPVGWRYFSRLAMFMWPSPTRLQNEPTILCISWDPWKKWGFDNDIWIVYKIFLHLWRTIELGN